MDYEILLQWAHFDTAVVIMLSFSIIQVCFFFSLGPVPEAEYFNYIHCQMHLMCTFGIMLTEWKLCSLPCSLQRVKFLYICPHIYRITVEVYSHSSAGLSVPGCAISRSPHETVFRKTFK